MPSTPPHAGHLLAAAETLSPPRGRAGGVDHAVVVRTALRIVDEEHLGALTIRRLAQELGVALATVYSLVGGKEEILNALVESVLSEVPAAPPDPEDWEQAVVELLVSVHEVFIAHAAVAHLALLRRITGARALTTQESILRLLRLGGLDEDTTARAYMTLTSYLMGFTMLRISRAEDAGHEQPDRGAALAAFPLAASLVPTLVERTSTPGFAHGVRHLLRSFTGGAADLAQA